MQGENTGKGEWNVLRGKGLWKGGVCDNEPCVCVRQRVKVRYFLSLVGFLCLFCLN